jgi:queuine tRNA-ribosyltransferase
MVVTTTKLNSPVIDLLRGRTKLIFRSRTTTITSPYSNNRSSSSSSSSSNNDNDDNIHPPLPSPFDFPSWAYHPKPYFRFDILHQSTKSMARVGQIITPNGIVDTPGYVAVGTNATIKAIDFDIANSQYVNQQLVFANTYHLMLHPGTDIIRDAGGIHQFTGRRGGGGPFITDSGGFQIFSLQYGGVTESRRESKVGELKRAATALSSKKKTSKSKSHWRSDVIGKVKVTEEHVEFRNYRNGAKVILSPESSIRAQKDIGADVSS